MQSQSVACMWLDCHSSLSCAELDDAPGVVIVGMISIFAPMVIAVFAAVLQRLLQEAITIKSENDLTV